MALAAGTRLGPYEIVAPLGAGGMGEVYRARDTRLERTVAIKVIPAHLASDRDLKQRLEREAKAISALNHPHICTLHDVGSQDGIDFLVMEYLEGETLAERLKKKPLPLDQLLKTAIEIADALDKAHRAGIVHRDLKPGNIMLTKAGSKLMDFGLARLARPAALNSVLPAASSEAMTAAAASPAAPPPQPAIADATTAVLPPHTPPSAPLTAFGAVVGTVQYISPEQVNGQEADARSDIFAFGAVLYEMATGQRAFDGSTPLSVASAILEKEPVPIAQLQPGIPPALEDIIATCLAKDPEKRYASAHDVGLQLKLVGTKPPQETPAPGGARRFREALLLAVLAFMLLVAGWLGYSRGRQAHAPRMLVESSLDLPQYNLSTSNNYAAGWGTLSLAFSSDGQYLAFTGSSPTSGSQIWVRPMRSRSAYALAGTEGGFAPFWSPDARSLAFFVRGQLKKVTLAGGVVSTLCSASFFNGTWGTRGAIVFGGGANSPFQGVPAAGSDSQPITTAVDGYRPSFLPDGRHFLYVDRTDTGLEGSVKVADIEGGPPVNLGIHTASRALYASGYLVYPTSTHIVAQRFDPDRLRLLDDPVVIVEGGQTYFAAASPFAVSESGLLVYRAAGGSGAEQIQLISRDGRVTTSGIPMGFNNNPRFSPDDKRIAYDVISGANRDIWIYDLERRTNTRFTLGGGMYSDPLWSPDGKRIAYSTGEPTSGRVMIESTDGGSEETLLEMPGSVWARSWSPDGAFLFLEFLIRPKSGGVQRSIAALAIKDHKQISLAPDDRFERRSPAISPDGRWLAYVSNESGREDVYLQSFPGNANRVPVSSGGGVMPRWRGDGRELYFINGSLKVAAVEISTKGDEVQLGATHELFPVNPLYPGGNPLDVTRDGKLFLIDTMYGSEGGPVILITNWDAALPK